jgi:hypothetical protein
MALMRGYDSIQVVDKGEVIICSGQCATKTYSDTCPPVGMSYEDDGDDYDNHDSYD